MAADRIIGFLLAVSSSIFIGISFVLTKKGHINSEGSGDGDSYAYLKSKTWWLGMITMIFGEVANFAAYTFAPAILVTPLGALSVLISSLLASIVLKEKISQSARIGCVLCLIGSVIIGMMLHCIKLMKVINAPGEKEITSITEIVEGALSFGFLLWLLFVVVYSGYAIFYLVPRHGKTNSLVYISICSVIGSISVMSCKGLGIAIRLTIEGNNQFMNFSTYVCLITVAVCVLTQLNYLNKALDIFSTALVTPIYYVFFTTATIIASILLFKGFNETTTGQVLSSFLGFIIMIAGVYLLSVEHMGKKSGEFTPIVDFATDNEEISLKTFKEYDLVLSP